MSVVDCSFDSEKDTKKEVKPMTSAVATDLDFVTSSVRDVMHDGFTRHARPSALDRAIMRLSVAMLRWARTHADRSFRSWGELAQTNRNALDREARENAALLCLLRIL